MSARHRRNVPRREDTVISLRRKVTEWKTAVSTSLGAINFLLLGGTGELTGEQKRFLDVAKKNLEALFGEIKKAGGHLKEG